MNELEARELRYFVAVAEELHFGSAAARLQVAQPAVSRTISKLERRLGVRLMERSTRRVRLTPAGSVLLDQARIALDALTAAERLTVRAAQDQRTIVVALKPDGDAGVLAPAMTIYEAEPAAVEVRPLLVGAPQLTACLRDGRADVALLAQPFDGRGLDWEEVLQEPRVVALPPKHPLALAEQLSLDDLRDEPIVRWAAVEPAADAFFQGRDHGDGVGRTVGSGPLVHDFAEALRLIELGYAVTFLPRSVAERFPGRGIAYRPVYDLSPSRLNVVWRAAAQSTALASLVRAIRTAGDTLADALNAPHP